MFLWFEGEGIDVNTAVKWDVLVVLEWLDKGEVVTIAGVEAVLAVELNIGGVSGGVDKVRSTWVLEWRSPGRSIDTVARRPDASLGSEVSPLVTVAVWLNGPY